MTADASPGLGAWARHKTVGVIGGMGPAATVDFMKRLIDATPATRDAQHLRLIIDNDPTIPDRVAAIFGTGPSPASRLATIARGLAAQGAELIVMPCNTAHAFATAIRDATDVPFLDMIEETADAAVKRADGPVGLLATSGCLRAGLYQMALQRYGRSTLSPSVDAQRSLMKAIRSIKGGRRQHAATAVISAAEELLERGATGLIVGCTEIPLVVSSAVLPLPATISTEVLVASTLREAYGRTTRTDDGSSH